ncbi:putative membrane-bound hydrogenase subunit mbhJ [uncultured archaeon]|nr:putative membrane-bound hydrogenase subunit mbhJ [uncultured archaeon]
MREMIYNKMAIPISNLFKRKTESFKFKDKEFEELGLKLKKEVDKIFGKSISIRLVDTGSDNSPEIELVNLTTPYYDIERFGINFVASPRHADIILVTGPVALNMLEALKKTYEAAPSPKFVIALGDDACGTGIFKDSYAVVGSVEKVLPVDMKIPGNPPTPEDILKGMLGLMQKIKNKE